MGKMLQQVVMVSLVIWSFATVIEKFANFNFVQHFNGVKFEGFYLIPNRKYKVSEITHDGLRKFIYLLKSIKFVSGISLLVSLLLSIALRLST